MNTIKNYFPESPTKESQNMDLIVSNMQFVIKIDKKRKKKKEKRKQKNGQENDVEISGIANILSKNLSFISPIKTLNNIKIQSDTDHEGGDKLADKNIIKLQKTEKIIEPKKLKSQKVLGIFPEQQIEQLDKSKTSKNVFQIMMNARNRSIGTNSSGQELTADEDIKASSLQIETKKKRKLMLDKWADEKGRAVKRMQEEAEEDFINKKMDQRAKRLKQILSIDSTDKRKSFIKTAKIKKNKKKKIKPINVDSSDDEKPSDNSSSILNNDDAQVNGCSLKEKANHLGLGKDIESPKTIERSDKSLRPKRICRLKPKKYTFDISPEKKPIKTQNDKNYKLLTNTETCDYDPIKGKYKKDIKLAPLFVKSIPKPIVDPAIIQAKNEFLMSGIPDKLRCEINRQKSFEENYEFNYFCFPKISHVTQLLNSKSTNINDLEKHLNLMEYNELISTNDNKMKYDYKIVSSNEIFNKNQKLEPIINLSGNAKEQLIKSLKLSYEKFPTFRCYTQLKKKCKLSKSFTKDKKSLDKSFEIIEDDTVTEYETKLFTEKFRPIKFNEILFNKTPIKNLKNFLSSWTIKSRCSDSDFNEESSSSLSKLMNSIVLLGPPGSGKTSAVFLIANDMNFKVLEINFGSKRTGKKILEKLQEATQSHNVHSKNENGTIKKNFKIEDNVEEKKLTLILIEDADIVFEQDDGFINAINQLVLTSKRPVIFVANNPKCQHLAKYISQNSIVFGKAQTAYIGKYLSILSIIENVPVSCTELMKLYKFNNQDLRKTMLELEFYIQSGGDLKSDITLDSISQSDDIQIHTKIYDYFINEANFNLLLPFPINFDSLWCNLSIQNNNISNNNFYEYISCGLFYNKNNSNNRILINYTDEIIYKIIELTIKTCNTRFKNDKFDALNTIYHKEKNNLFEKLMSPNLFSRNSSEISLDYEPYLRSICRTERNRNHHQNRRGSRFYHYLRNSNATCFNFDVYDEYLLVFEENI